MSGIKNISDGYAVIERDVVGSTNDEASVLAAEGAADGTVVWARRQTEGRGRRGRRWQSPEGNLHCSVVMRPDVGPAAAAQTSLVSAVAVADMVAGFLMSDQRVEQKWPNDVLVDGAKIAGILLESSGPSSGRVDWVVIGCGVNVAAAPDDPAMRATSLHREGAQSVTAKEALRALLDSLRTWRARWETAGLAPVRAAWLARAHGLRGPITVRLPDRELQGRFADMDDSGSLVLELPGGQRRKIAAGDVFF